MDQEQAHRAQQEQQNHVVSHVSPNLPHLFGKNNAAPGDWAHTLSEAETGCLLLAPEDEGGWWQYSVVLILNHDTEGSTGVILNRPTNELLHRGGRASGLQHTPHLIDNIRFFRSGIK